MGGEPTAAVNLSVPRMEIATHCRVSYSTVHTPIERNYHKLHVRSRAKAMAKIYGPRG